MREFIAFLILCVILLFFAVIVTVEHRPQGYAMPLLSRLRASAGANPVAPGNPDSVRHRDTLLAHRAASPAKARNHSLPSMNWSEKP